MGVRFEKFELGKLFDISTTKGTDKNKIKLSDTGDIEFIGRTSVNWGIQGYTEELSYAPNPKNSFSLVQVGETVALWREREWYASQNIFLLVPKFSEINNTYLYFQGVINKEMIVYGKGYTTYPTLNKLKHTTLYLPIVMNGNSPEVDTTHKYHKDGYIPDFEYMEKYIAELEAERIAELEAYLVATGLNDYTLTDEDKQVLSLHNAEWGNKDRDNAVVDGVRFEEFRFADVFTVEQVNKVKVSGKNYVPDNDIISDDGTVPYIAAISTNNGITGYSSKYEANNKGDCITLSTTADSSNTVFYQPDNFIGRQQIAGIRRRDKQKMGKYVGLYIVAIVKRVTVLFNYGTKLTVGYLRDKLINLPIKVDALGIPEKDTECYYHKDGYIPDFEYMERYIKAMQKVVIADVVKYKDEVIEKTKSIVGV